MSTLTASSVSQSSSPRPTRWAQADGGLWVAARAGTHLGRVERTGPAFRAYTGLGVVLGDFPTLTAAQHAVASLG